VAVKAAEPDSERDGKTRETPAAPSAEGGLFGRTGMLPGRLTPRQVLQLQRTVGNRTTGRIAGRAGRPTLQRTPEAMVPLAVRFDRALTREEFIRLANEQLKLDPKRGTWQNVKDHYRPEDSPVRVKVAVGLLKAQRSQTTAATVGLGVDPSGAIAGAEQRAAELTTMSDTERAQLYAEIDRRYWATTGIPAGEKIKSRAGEAGNVAMWEQIRDELLAERAFVAALPEKARQVIRQSTDGLVIGPQHYEQIVRIANKIERMDAADLENYLTGALTTTDLGQLEKAVDRFLEIKEAAPGKIEKLRELTEAGDWDVDAEAAALDEDTMFYLSLADRIKVMKEIAGGTVVGNEDERTIIRLLTSTPTGDLPGLLEALKADGSELLKQLESAIDGEENKLYYAALRNIVFRSLDPATAHQKLQNARVLPWSDPGLLKAYTNPRFYYETVEYTADGKVRVVYWANLGPMGFKQPEQLFEPDEIIALQFHLDEDFAAAVKGETVFMPAANMLAFKNEQFSRELGLAVDIGLLFAGGAGLLAKGTRLAKAVAAIDLTIAAADIVVDSFRGDIAKTPEGKSFLRAWDTVNTLIAVYGAGRLVISLPEVFRNLKKAWRAFRDKPGDIAPDDLRRLDDEAGGLIGKADEALLEAEFAGLRGRFSDDVLKPFEPQLAKARGIEDAAKRKAAIADLESQVEAQQENLALVAELKKANPTMKNKQIADLAAGSIKVPKVPLGMDADEFQRAQGLIKKWLHDKGLTDVEGFVTGSRVTGVTFNPKKPAFGQVSGDLSTKDLDITLITPRKLSNSEVEALMALYKRELKHPLGVRNVVDREQLKYIPVYGKIDLALK
jgi:hypothetical protein